MFRRLRFLLLALLLPLLLLGLVTHASHIGAQDGDWELKIDPALVTILEQERPETVRFLVRLRDEAVIGEPLPREVLQRRSFIVDQLRHVAGPSQRGLLAHLEALQTEGSVTLIRSLWIINAIVVEGHPQTIPLIAARPEVSSIAHDAKQQFLRPPELQPQEAMPSDWNLQQVRAPLVWTGLGVTGLGVTVAIMDTGVDWSHPDLHDNYRGLQADGSVQHEGNWFDALEGHASGGPTDANGHGTHVAGTAVGRGGTGVAPDARWIAVRAFDSGGFATTSNLHLAFQWLLAPGGRPELAPDIVNGSWSGPGNNPEFARDIQILYQAGIASFFAAGNSGPDAGSIGAPASYSQAIAVAASDYRKEVTWFSSRGPSALTGAPKPDLAAPGARIYSTLPGGAYGYYNGTSMAAPHVAGAAALILAANPQLDVDSLRRTLTATTQYGPQDGYDIHQGWGQLDAYAAVASQLNAGRVEGAVTSAGDAVSGAVVTITMPSGVALNLRTDQSGRYHAWLRPGDYRLQAGKFGYTSAPLLTVRVSAGGTAHQNLAISREPHTSVRGFVRSTGGEPLRDVSVFVENAPISATTDSEGWYSLAIPTGGPYRLHVRQNGFRLAEMEVILPDAQQREANFTLVPAQSILLVDSGRWYYDSHASYFTEALLNAGYAYDEWKVYSPDESPPAATLAQYDTVIWTAPQDAPGWIGGGDALVTFLDGGGNLLVSGQNVARRDGINPLAHEWFTDYLQAAYLGTASAPYTVTSTGNGPYRGLYFPLNSSETAENQVAPSQIGPARDSLTEPLLSYLGDDESSAAAVAAGHCRPFQILFMGFGLEGAASAVTRTDLMHRSLAHFEAPPLERGLALNPSQTNEVVLPGQALTVTYSLRNMSEVQTATIALEYDSQWESHLSHRRVRLGPCQKQAITLTLRAPSSLASGERQAIELTARADYGAVAGASIVASAPERILLVADYRWYDETSAYRQSLNELHLPFDIWDTNNRGSPPLERLSAYDYVLWFTGYDWYEPLTAAETEVLEGYLQQGGRLFFSSQDYLYYHRQKSLTRDYLGVLDYQESLTSTILFGGENALLGDGIGPLPLFFDTYRNFGDGLLPMPGASVHVWNDWGAAAAIVSAGEHWRTVFWGVPFELLASENREKLLADVMGRLGNLGDSTMQVFPRIGPQSAIRHYTLTVRNWHHAQTHTVMATTTLPLELSVLPASLGEGLAYDRSQHELYWQGTIEPGSERVIRFSVLPSRQVRPGSRFDVTTTLAYEGMLLPWQMSRSIWVDAPDLGASYLAVGPLEARANQRLTYTAYLQNRTDVVAPQVTAGLRIPYGLVPITTSLNSPGGDVTIQGHQVQWLGSLGANAITSFTVAVTTTNFVESRTFAAGLVIDDDIAAPIVRTANLSIFPDRWYLPLIHR